MHKVFYGYIIVAASVCIMALVWGTNRAFGVFLGPMLNEFGWTRAGISGAFTIVMVIMGGMSIVSGRLSDRFGPRVVLIGCGLFMGLGYMLVSQVRAIWQFYLFYGVIVGLGLSACNIPLMSSVARWFLKRRTLMTGILMAGAALGVVVIPLVCSLLISTLGWRISYFILGSSVFVIITSSAFFLRREPGEMELLPYGSERINAVGSDIQAEGLSLADAVRTKQLWLLNIVSFGDRFLINVVVVHIVIHALGLGIPATAAASVLSVAAGISIPARIIMGGVADKIGNRSTLMICIFISLAAFLLLLVAERLWMLYLFSVLYGFGLWVTGTIMSPITADLFGLRSHGTILACNALPGAIGAAVGPILVGHIFDVTGSYQLGFFICIAVSIMDLIAIILLRPIRNKE